MAILLLIRHVEHLLQHQILLGRTHHAAFTEQGKVRLKLLAESLRPEAVAAVHSSPQRRAWYTASAIATHHKLPVGLRPELDELDYGEWSGRGFDELCLDPLWQRWNSNRSAHCPPHGESKRALQQRMLSYTAQLARFHSDKTFICVTHAEPIRVVILHACGLSLDEFARVEVAPGSVTRLNLAAPAGKPEFSVEAQSA